MSVPVLGLVVAPPLWVAISLITARMGRIAISRAQFDWRSHLEFRTEYERFLSSRLIDSFREGGSRLVAWMVVLLAAGFGLAAAEFSLGFVLGFAATVAAYLAIVDVEFHWAQRLTASDVMGPPTGGTRLWSILFGLMDWLGTSVYFGFFGCAGAALAELAGL